MFAKLLSISDDMMWRYFTLLSFRAEAEIGQLRPRWRRRRNPKDAKVMLAKEITARFHSAAAAERAEADFQLRSRGGVPDDIPQVALARCAAGHRRLLKQADLAPSHQRGAAPGRAGRRAHRRRHRRRDKGLKLPAGTYVVQVGKRKFARVTLGA